MVNKAKHFSLQNIEQMEQRYRAHFVNSLSGFKSANLIGTVDAKGRTNLSIVSSVFHLGSSPALVGFINRPRVGGDSQVERHTLENIIENGCYTINHVAASFYQQAHQTSARYSRNTSEFDATGLTEEYVTDIKAPFVKESRLKYSVELVEHQTLLNNTELVIGQIQHVIVDETAVKNDGLIDLSVLDTVAVSGLDCYHQSEKLVRLSYAKPDKAPTIIED